MFVNMFESDKRCGSDLWVFGVVMLVIGCTPLHAHTYTRAHAHTIHQMSRSTCSIVHTPTQSLTFTTICRFFPGYWGPEFCTHSELSASIRGLKETFNQIDTRGGREVENSRQNLKRGATKETTWKRCYLDWNRGLMSLQHTATLCNALQHTATHCNALQHTATHCNALQHTSTHCSTLQLGEGVIKTEIKQTSE